MILGEIPGLALDRTGVALLGAIGVVAVGRPTAGGVWSGVDMPTLQLLFAMMVVSAQFRLAGFLHARLPPDRPRERLAAAPAGAGRRL